MPNKLCHYIFRIKCLYWNNMSLKFIKTVKNSQFFIKTPNLGLIYRFPVCHVCWKIREIESVWSDTKFCFMNRMIFAFKMQESGILEKWRILFKITPLGPQKIQETGLPSVSPGLFQNTLTQTTIRPSLVLLYKSAV